MIKGNGSTARARFRRSHAVGEMASARTSRYYGVTLATIIVGSLFLSLFLSLSLSVFFFFSCLVYGKTGS